MNRFEKDLLEALDGNENKTVYNYDRGLDVKPTDEDTEIALAILIKEYN